MGASALKSAKSPRPSHHPTSPLTNHDEVYAYKTTNALFFAMVLVLCNYFIGCESLDHNIVPISSS
eukprot:scaffold7977_cov77-Cyclotella_meneghiniana.AAC.6